jgi:predicted phosphodiesterase
MARYGVIADVHGNDTALAVVLRDLERQRVDRVVALGDIVGYNASPNECVRTLARNDIPSIHGNHDLIALQRLGFERCAKRPAHALRRTRQTLDAVSRRYLDALPAHAVHADVLAIHGGPDDVTEYLRSPAQLARAAGAVQDRYPRVHLCLFAHTHVPKVFHVEAGAVSEHAAAEQTLAESAGVYFVNPGSVDGSRRTGGAQYAILDLHTYAISFHEVAYDRDAVEAAARADGYRMTMVDEIAWRMKRCWMWRS